MSKGNSFLSQAERALFQEAVSGTKMLLQDSIVPYHQKRKIRKSRSERLFQQEIETRRYFSDASPGFIRENTRCYYRPDVHHDEIRRFGQGDYTPECFLDLHGLTQYQAKWQLAAFIVACYRRRIRCACIIHGHGRSILKQCVPSWLAESPWIQAFHEAPQRWGGSAALLFMVDPEAYHYR